jgi:hypothetical protein
METTPPRTDTKMASDTLPRTVANVAAERASMGTEEDSVELWSMSSALMFMICIVMAIFFAVMGMDTVMDLQRIKNNWADYRCSPLIMPFASLFGEDTKQNFDFCLGKSFNNHSQGIVGSILAMFTQFSTLLESIFDSLSSLRTTIATLGGGINVIFQEFTERISNFFYQLRLSAIRIKLLMGRLYAILFSIMYMGTSGITGMSSFTNTYLFSFLDTFCFPGETELNVRRDSGIVRIPIQEITIGDVLMPGNTRVTATFEFYSTGQPMVRVGPALVSTNHYLLHNGVPIMAGEHPSAVPYGPWDSPAHLFCVNTTDHTIPIEYLTFLDYDETPEGDAETLEWIEGRINGTPSVGKTYPYKDACFSIEGDAKIKTKNGLKYAKDIKIGEELTTGSCVVGTIRREVSQVCTLPNGTRITPATLYWDNNQWRRLGETYKYKETTYIFVSFVVVPNSQLELEDGTHVRDYMELCSPDAEMHYSALLEGK